MNDYAEILATMSGPAGSVIRITPEGWRLGDEPIPEHVVADLLRRSWIFPTRRPVVTGSPLTGRMVIAGRGRRALAIMRRKEAA
jgi:hypothetical protein